MARSLTRSMATLAAVLLLGGWTWSAPAAAGGKAERVAVQADKATRAEAPVCHVLPHRPGACHLAPGSRIRPRASVRHPRLAFLRSVILLR
ncbi:MAG: hypothetical protein ACOCYP_02695 [Planctomycetota bacterium]